MHHKADVSSPDGFGYSTLQERRDDQVRLIEVDGLQRDFVVDVELHRYFVSRLLELDVQSLGKAVERVGQEQDAHVFASP